MDHFLLGAITKKGCDPDLGVASGSQVVAVLLKQYVWRPGADAETFRREKKIHLEQLA